MKHANVAIFVPHNGCPHQCSFCNQRTITGQMTQPLPQDVRNAVQIAKNSLHSDTKNAEIAFFGGSFTAIEPGYMVSLLEAAAPFVKDGTFAGIRISTRPDCIDEDVLKLLKGYGVTAIELGAQSMDDRVLQLNKRGHTAEQVAAASELIRSHGFTLGLQMMTGLYGDTVQGSKLTARKLSALHPQNMRIYPTIIMRGTELGEKYLRGEYQTLNLEETVQLCAELLDFFEEQGIRVIRLGLHSSPELEWDMLAGPWHPAFRELCESARMLRNITGYLKQNPQLQGSIMIKVNPKTVSKAAGQKKCNLTALAQMGYCVKIVQDADVLENCFTIE
ncbi:elongator complex protein 3 [Caproiciproducens faecalis]|uniref:Radical SAM protein n=1 Tax=Caproiciproducens faecalis TaxID=2820301 RepID=A0ABS7DRC5_9FIRM|nr:radical SAM protein [Caproiciproducens faecalis]MBW7573572.1 radical SAM protein [Caproiciproducens faecalis]